MISRIASILKHLSRSNEPIPYKLRNTSNKKDFNCSLLFDFFEQSKIPFITSRGEFDAAFKFGNDTIEAYDIGNAGLISRHILKNYISEDYQVLFSKLCSQYIRLMNFIDVSISVSRKGCLFHVEKKAKSLNQIYSYSTFYKSNFIYDDRYRITKLKFDNDLVVGKEICINLSFNGESGYTETGQNVVITIDYYKQDQFLFDVIEFHKKEFIYKLGISDNDVTIKDIYELYTMLTI